MSKQSPKRPSSRRSLRFAGPVLVDFWAGVVYAVLRRRARSRANRRGARPQARQRQLRQEQGLAQRFGVQSIPNMILFENGEPKAHAIGAQPKSALERTLGLEV